jgi:hypothetical protein
MLNQLTPSSWNTYKPEKVEYKFISVAIYVSVDSEITHRMMGSIFDYIGDVGGLNDIVATAFAFFLITYSNNRTYAILMNRLYHLTETLEEGQ